MTRFTKQNKKKKTENICKNDNLYFRDCIYAQSCMFYIPKWFNPNTLNARLEMKKTEQQWMLKKAE